MYTLYYTTVYNVCDSMLTVYYTILYSTLITGPPLFGGLSFFLNGLRWSLLCDAGLLLLIPVIGILGMSGRYAKLGSSSVVRSGEAHPPPLVLIDSADENIESAPFTYPYSDNNASNKVETME